MKQITVEKPMMKNDVELEPICPNCDGLRLGTEKVILSDWPYLHADVQRSCRDCEWKGIHGIPMDHDDGTELLLYDVDTEKADQVLRRVEFPECDWHGETMEPSKIMMVGNGDVPFVQFKCPECYLVRGNKV